MIGRGGNRMQTKTCEIQEDKIVEAVRYAVSKRFCLGELSRLLVMEGGVDLDTLSRIIRENRGDREDQGEPPVQPEFLQPVIQEKKSLRKWFGLREAI